MERPINNLDVVALTVDLPDHHLMRGQVGTVVVQLAQDVYEVEFVDNSGRTDAMVPVQTDQFMVLHFQPVAA